MPLSEFDVISRFFSRCGARRADVVLGVGDDGAVLECPPGSQLVAAIDSLVEDVHFPAGSPARFEARVSDNHHHVICRGCGRTADVDCAVGEAPCLIAVDDRGYEIDEAEVIYWGRCPECRAQVTT